MNAQRYRQTITRSAACAELAERVDIEEAWALAEEEDKTPPEIGGALQLRNGRILCPRHGAAFDAKTGRVLSLPAVKGVQAYPVPRQGDDLFVDCEAHS